MCKPHKDRTAGDAKRMPYRARKQFPSRRGKRMNRHDTGRWGDEW